MSETIRRAKVVCNCGQFEAQIHQPVSSFKWVDPICSMCACLTCTDFQEKVLKAYPNNTSKLEERCTPGLTLFQFYKNDFTITKGSELLKVFKYTTKSNVVRYYTTCCGTALGVTPMPDIFINLVTQNIQPIETLAENESHLTVPEPQVCFWKENIKPIFPIVPASMPLVNGFNSLTGISRFFGCAFQLKFCGTSEGSGFPMNEDNTTIGLDNIKGV